MTWGWQDVVALALVLAAAASLVRMVVHRASRKSTGGRVTGGCGSCPLRPAARLAARCDERHGSWLGFDPPGAADPPCATAPDG